MTPILAICAAAIAAYMAVIWLLSLPLKDASIADVFWGPGFAFTAIVAALLSPSSARATLLVVLTSAWGLRLAFHIGRRW